MRKKIDLFVIWSIVICGFCFLSKFANADDSIKNYNYSERNTPSWGERRQQFTIPVGSHSATSPFIKASFSNGKTGQSEELRRISFVNDTSNYIMLMTSKTTNPNHAFWIVPRSTFGTNIYEPYHTYESFSRATFYMVLETGGTMQIKINIEK